jgi:hypothetical protein
MDLNIRRNFGVRTVELVAANPDAEPSAIIELEAQGGLIVRLHMEASEWRWLAIDLYQKKQAEDRRMNEE